MAPLAQLAGRLVLIAIAGLAVGLGAFTLSSDHAPRGAHSSPPCYDLQTEEAHFDLWSGRPVGLVLTCSQPVGGTPWDLRAPAPEDMAGRSAIPFPVGFAAGALIAGGLLHVVDRRRRTAS